MYNKYRDSHHGRASSTQNALLPGVLFVSEFYYMLLNTHPWNLIEATLDLYWGAGCRIGSIALEEGSWEGENNLGKLLVKVRTYFVKELERGQGSIQ